MADVFRFAVGRGGDFGGDVEIGFAAFHEALFSKTQQGFVIGKRPLLDGVEGEHFRPGHIGMDQQGAAVVFIDETALNPEDDVAGNR